MRGMRCKEIFSHEPMLQDVMFFFTLHLLEFFLSSGHSLKIVFLTFFTIDLNLILTIAFVVVVSFLAVMRCYNLQLFAAISFSYITLAALWISTREDWRGRGNQLPTKEIRPRQKVFCLLFIIIVIVVVLPDILYFW